MKNRIRISALLSILCAAIWAPIVRAAPTQYTITFTATSGTAPTAGQFTYDPSVPQFTAFTVNWQGYTFDLTNSANHPSTNSVFPACIGTAIGAAATFNLLQNGICLTATTQTPYPIVWQGNPGINFAPNCPQVGPCSSPSSFTFVDFVAPPYSLISISVNGPVPPSNSFLGAGQGTWVIQASTPAYLTSQLLALATGMNITGQGNSINAQILQVATDINNNTLGLACSDLKAFASHVKAQSGKKITTAQAQQILAAVALIATAIPCP